MGQNPSALPLTSSRSSKATGPVRARRGRLALPFPGIQLARNLLKLAAGQALGETAGSAIVEFTAPTESGLQSMNRQAARR